MDTTSKTFRLAIAPAATPVATGAIDLLLRDGARRMLQAAIECEVAARRV